MGFKCVATGCRSGYGPLKGTPSEQDMPSASTSFHKFPVNSKELLKLWLTNMQREDYEPTDSSRLCSLHFCDFWFTESRSDRNVSRIRTKSSFLLRRRLLDNAVPTIFPNSPDYKPKQDTVEWIERALAEKESKDKEEYDKLQHDLECAKKVAENSFTNIQEAFQRLNDGLKTPAGLTWVLKDDTLMLLYLDSSIPVRMLGCIAITEELDVNITINDELVDKKLYVGKLNMEFKVKTYTAMVQLMDFTKAEIDKLEYEDRHKAILQKVKQLVAEYGYFFKSEEDLIKINFVLEQLELIGKNEVSRRYSQDTILMCYLLYCASPSGYNELRSQNFLTLPSPRTLNNLKKEANKLPEDVHMPASPSYNLNYEQDEATLPQQSISSDPQETLGQSHYKEKIGDIEENDHSHEIKSSHLPSAIQTNNAEFILDPTNFMEQSLTTEQAYISNQAAKDRESPTNSASMMITASNDNSLDCSQSDSSAYIEESAVQGPSHSSISPGLGIQYDSNSNNTSGGLMVYGEPGTSSSGVSGNSAITPNRPGSPSKASADNQRRWHKDHINCGYKSHYICQVCEKVFHQSSHRSRHLATIHSNRFFRCQYCSNTFNRKDNLSHHIKKFSPPGSYENSKRKFKCSICDKTFKQRHHLQRHNQSSHLNIRFQCDLCNKSFTRKEHIKLHKQGSHREFLVLYKDDF